MCTGLIPDEMHQNGRNSEPFDDGKEKLFLRFPASEDLEVDCTKLRPAFFEIRAQSVNRSRFSEALWVTLPDWKGWGIATSLFENIDLSEFRTNDPKSAVYKFEPTHHPCACNYAHSEIRVLKNGMFDRHSKVGATVKQQMQIALYKAFDVSTMPSHTPEGQVP